MFDLILRVYLGFTLVIAPQVSAESGEHGLIFPGTKWCGPGNIAKNDNDLGKECETDSCCRTHDKCPDLMEAGESKHGLENDSRYTRLNCKCDNDFLTCLQSVRIKEKATATIIGNTYFNLIGQQCFKYDYPVERCIRYYEPAVNKCAEYKHDTTAPKKWEYVDVPYYNTVDSTTVG